MAKSARTPIPRNNAGQSSDLKCTCNPALDLHRKFRWRRDFASAPMAKLRAALFDTCLVDQIFPRVGESVVRIQRHFVIEVTFNPAQTCCGQPHGTTTKERSRALFQNSGH